MTPPTFDTPSSPPRPSEASLEAHFARRIVSLGGLSLKIAPTTAGAPDRLVLIPGGWMYLVELKTATGRLRAVQRVWHEKARALDHHVYVLYGREGIESWLAEVFRRLAPLDASAVPHTS